MELNSSESYIRVNGYCISKTFQPIQFDTLNWIQRNSFWHRRPSWRTKMNSWIILMYNVYGILPRFFAQWMVCFVNWIWFWTWRNWIWTRRFTTTAKPHLTAGKNPLSPGAGLPYEKGEDARRLA